MLAFLLAFVVHELDSLLLTRLQPRAVRLPPGAPRQPKYVRLLGAGSLLERPPDECSRDLDGPSWKLPILTANYELQAVLLREIARWQAASLADATWRARLTGYLLANSYLGGRAWNPWPPTFTRVPAACSARCGQKAPAIRKWPTQCAKLLPLHYLQASA